MEIKIKDPKGKELTFDNVMEAARWGMKQIQKVKNRLKQMRKERKELKTYVNYLETELGFKRKREKKKKEEIKETEKAEIEKVEIEKV